MNKNTKIDFNCDLGEGLDNEHLLMPYLSSCNIACGAHAGSVEVIDKVIELALSHGVKIGVHPSYPDKENFGRVVLEMTDVELHESLKDQLQLFKERAAMQDATIHHVKPHGALYNLIAVDEEKAVIVSKAVKAIFDDVKLYVPFNSKIEKVARDQGIEIIYEAFADRNYNDDLTLVSRSEPDATITDKEQVVTHVKRMFEESKVKTIQDNERDIKAETFCLHGDNEKAIEILKTLHQEFL
ncbi:5-oxoprolinase subunit PxpA [Salibacter halophilus]|uniref:5-oxoprolinase subunit PxpA n=1 Tax=Salibacter halophilus TaxID=1803916 RepID=A0A6N6ME04_9FLAO|nr:5-oxoprolinase subunit PxpA [Salibacter halophilus]KAB1065945.1 5-oxoprolinase subunit PxpA [Salibacter halophilus]